MLIGVNTDPRHWPDFATHAQNLRAAGMQVARFPLAANSGVDYQAFCEALAAEGIEPLPVYASESVTISLQSWQSQLGQTVHKWQLGNEPDSTDPSSSWVMTQTQLSRLLAEGRAALGSNVTLIAGGLVSGQPGWLDSVDLSPVDAIGVHPYGQRPSPDFPNPTWEFGNAADLINAYKRFGKPIWVDEYGAVLGQFTDANQRGQYYGQMLTMAANNGCAAGIPFCWGDKMVPGFGLLDASDNPTPAYYAFQAAALALEQPQPKEYTMNIWTGAHFCSPISAGANNLQSAQNLQAMGRWGSVIICPGNTADFRDACDQIVAHVGNGNLSQCIARIYYPNAIDTPGGDPMFTSVADADNWLASHGYYDALDYFIARGGTMAQIFNELNVKSEPQYGIHPVDLGRLAFALANHYWNGGNRKLYILFPGPSGLLGWSGGSWDTCFLGYYQKYHFVDANGQNPETFGQAFPSHVAVGDPLHDRTMLWHGGSGVFDRVALHCYAQNTTQLSDGNGANNPALQYCSFQHIIDPGWFYATEVGGFGGNTVVHGTAIAVFMYNADQQNVPFFGGQLKAAYAYILDPSDAGATSNGQNEIGGDFINGFNAERSRLGW